MSEQSTPASSQPKVIQSAAGTSPALPKPTEARFFFTVVLEDAIAQLPHVRGVRIIASDSAIEEIHVLSRKDVKPKMLARDIKTLLLVRFGVQIDHRCISIVESEEKRLSAFARPIIHTITEKDDNGSPVIQIELRAGGKSIFGVSPLSDNDSEVQAGCKATLDAIERLIGRQGELSLLEAQTLSMHGRDIVLVLVEWHFSGARDVLIGTGFSNDDRLAAAVRATLDAINRKLVRLPTVLED